jgi:outer membrane lipoprotein LolB
VSFLRSFLLAAIVALTGCASLSPPTAPVDPDAQSRHQRKLEDISAFSLSGRMAVQTEKRGFSGSLRWRHTEDGDHFALYSPLGTQVADINANKDGVTLTTNDRKTYKADNAETLLQQTMGWSLPLTGLSDWIIGRPTSSAYEVISRDAQGRLVRLKQDGWDIEYPTYQTVDGTDLPGKVILRSPQLDLKLLVERWGTLSREP